MSESVLKHHLFVVPKIGTDLELVCIVVDQLKIDLSQSWVIEVLHDDGIAVVCFYRVGRVERHMATFVVPDEDCGCSDD